jgi:hypothetical protein
MGDFKIDKFEDIVILDQRRHGRRKTSPEILAVWQKKLKMRCLNLFAYALTRE